jgi:hypothetical protein
VQHLRQHVTIPFLELGGDLGQPEERFGDGPRRRAEEVDVAERVVAAGADDQVRRVLGQVSRLLAHVFGRAPVNGAERRFGPLRQPLAYLPDDVGRVAYVCGVVEDRVSKENDVVQVLITRQE